MWKRALIALVAVLTITPAAILLWRIYSNTALPSEVVKVSRATVVNKDLRGGDDVSVQFEYCNSSFVKSRLVRVVLADNYEVPESDLLYRPSYVPTGCSTSTFVIFRMPAEMDGTMSAALTFDFSGVRQTFHTNTFQVR